MKSPKLYKVLNLSLLDIYDNNGVLVWNKKIEDHCLKYQQDNPLFRMIRNVTKNDDTIIRDIIFVDCKSSKRLKDFLEEIIDYGFMYNGSRYILAESSASMQRANQLSFISASIYPTIDKMISMDNIAMGSTVTTKMRAYRGLFISSCHMMPDKWFPKIVVVDGLKKIVKDCNIKYLSSEKREYEHKETGEKKEYEHREIKDGIKDVEIDCFDGFSIGSPNLFNEISDTLDIDRDMSSFILRMPYLKGLCVKVDYKKFFLDNDVEEILDIWGVSHSVYEDFIIADVSLHKGYKYFNKYGDYRDWEYYMDKCLEYNHVFGVAKYSVPKKDEKVYTRGNYQILQDLDLKFEEFKKLADTTLEYFGNVLDGDSYYATHFLGIDMSKDSIEPEEYYAKAIKKNAKILKQEGVRKKILNSIKGKIDDAKCGRIYLKSCFKFAAPDIIAFMQHIAGIEVSGCLGKNQFWTYGNKTDFVKGKKYLITRNPHIAKSEHLAIEYETNRIIEKYIGDIHNVYMIDILSPHMPRLSGCDFDGDLLLCIDEEIMVNAILGTNLAITMDVDDKITVEPEEYNNHSIKKAIFNNQDNRIGEISNMATCYINKFKRTDRIKKIHDDNICYLSICNGKEIDASKTGVRFNIPSYIQNYAKPFPYFMKYRSEYYGRLTDFNRYRSNMNAMCFMIEEWEMDNKSKKETDFDYKIMIDDTIEFVEEEYEDIKKIFEISGKKISKLVKENSMIKKYANFKTEKRIKEVSRMRKIDIEEATIVVANELENIKSYIRENIGNVSINTCKNWETNWNYYYEEIRNECLEILPNGKKIANYLIKFCYEEKKNCKSLIWNCFGDFVCSNIKEEFQSYIELSEHGEIEILGEKYREVL